jgi:hypothetical protein
MFFPAYGKGKNEFIQQQRPNYKGRTMDIVDRRIERDRDVKTDRQ